jgi:hypothetical protein
VIVAAAQVFESRPIAMFLALYADFLDALDYEMDASHFSSVLFYYVLSLVDILMIVLLIVLIVMIHSYRVHYVPSFIM